MVAFGCENTETEQSESAIQLSFPATMISTSNADDTSHCPTSAIRASSRMVITARTMYADPGSRQCHSGDGVSPSNTRIALLNTTQTAKAIRKNQVIRRFWTERQGNEILHLPTCRPSMAF
jgi:hypothetical protein